jgi:hypothetical protein
MLSYAVAKILRNPKIEKSLGLRRCENMMEQKWASKVRIVGEFVLANTELHIAAQIIGVTAAYFVAPEAFWITQHVYTNLCQTWAKSNLSLPLLGFIIFRTYRSAKNGTLRIATAPLANVLF